MDFIKILQIIVSILLITAVLMQNRSGGLSGVFGGSGGGFYMAKRGLEKKIFISTIALSIIFFAISFYVIIK
ncbi:MAG: preprotein translocase subunit SecG [Parcubacteria group bacterium ADurb.Bin316]|mgnify:CR=1 FL=1|nr:MAG: preprotein translocase subunit SecG [Parcubacteria group bacterium ADurb.Bin316]HOZ55686.1 preprotein translocase subunit SecG [bacterium]